MANVFQMSEFRHKPTRDAFDLSRKNLFSAKVGELLPSSIREIITGDKFDIKPQNFTRLQPVNSAAYTTIREHVDYYFVPTRVLWRGFPAWVTQQNTQTHFAASAQQQIELANVQPYLTVKQIHDHLCELLNDKELHANENYFGFGRAQNTVKLLQYLGYGDFTPTLENPTSDWSDLYNENLTLNMFPLLAYQAVADHYHRNTQWSNSHPYLFNVDYMVGSTPAEMQMQIPQISVLNTYLDLQYALYKKDYFMGLFPDSQFGSVSVVDCSGPGNVIGDVHFLTSNPTGVDSSSSPLSIVKDPAWSDVKGGILCSTSAEKLSDIMNASSMSYNGGTGQPITDFTPGPYDSEVYMSNPSSNYKSYNRIFISDADIASFNVLQLRLAEAQQKWKEVTQSNYYDYVSQISAHFGIKPNPILSHSPQYVGGYTSTINISEVLNTNITGDNQAYIAGKGVGSQMGQNIHFDNEKFGNENGYLIGIYYAEPILDYRSSGVLRQNLRSLPTDYCIPEYENVGMQALYVSELTNAKLENSGTSVKGSDVLGYGPRYYDYKASYDVVNGIFRKTLDYWAAPITDEYIDDYLSHNGVVDSDGKVHPGITSNWFKINPHLTDAIFGFKVDSSVDTDCLLINFYEDVKASRLISRYGLPY